MAWISFGALPYRKKKNLMTARVSTLKSRTFLTCFRACFLPGRAKNLSAPQYKARHWTRSWDGSVHILVSPQPTSYRQDCISVLSSSTNRNIQWTAHNKKFVTLHVWVTANWAILQREVLISKPTKKPRHYNDCLEWGYEVDETA